MKVQAIQIKKGYHHVTVLIENTKTVKQLYALNKELEFQVVGEAFETTPGELTELRVTTYMGFTIRLYVQKYAVDITKMLVDFFDRPVSVVVAGRSLGTFDLIKGVIGLVPGKMMAPCGA